MDFSMHAGDTKRLHFSITNGDDADSPLDISDTIVTWQASRGTAARFSSTPVLTKTIGDGLTVTDEINGAFTVELLPEDTEVLTGNYYHEVQIEDASGDIATAFTGEFRIKRALIA